MTNKWFRVSSNRSASKRRLAGKAGFGDLGVGERGARDKEGEGTHVRGATGQKGNKMYFICIYSIGFRGNALTYQFIS